MKQRSTEDIILRIVARPLFQAIVIFIFSALLALLDYKAGVLGVGTTGKNSPWVMMTAGILFYALSSSILSLKAERQNIYWREAILTFIGLLVASGLFATLISGLSIDEAGSFRWIFVVLSFGYLVFIAIVRLMRKIVEIAIKQDEKMRNE